MRDGRSALTAASTLICILIGYRVVTLGSFGAHSIASIWVRGEVAPRGAKPLGRFISLL